MLASTPDILPLRGRKRNQQEKRTQEQIQSGQIPSISKSDAMVLAERFRFSGGQIENIARKFVVDLVLEGVDVGFERLIQYCGDEKTGKEVRPLGFTA